MAAVAMKPPRTSAVPALNQRRRRSKVRVEGSVARQCGGGTEVQLDRAADSLQQRAGQTFHPDIAGGAPISGELSGREVALVEVAEGREHKQTVAQRPGEHDLEGIAGSHVVSLVGEHGSQLSVVDPVEEAATDDDLGFEDAVGARERLAQVHQVRFAAQARAPGSIHQARRRSQPTVTHDTIQTNRC
jgi:hypothetical protein